MWLVMGHVSNEILLNTDKASVITQKFPSPW